MASVDVDVEAGPLSLELRAAVADQAEAVRELRDDLRLSSRRTTARSYRITGSCSTGASFTGSGPIAMLLGRPSYGRIWVVEYVTAWVGVAIAGGATANLNCAVMVGRCPVGEGALYNVANASVAPINVSDVVIPTQAVPPPPLGLPSLGVVNPEDQLYVILGGSGLAASIQYNAAAGVLDLPDVPGAILWR